MYSFPTVTNNEPTFQLKLIGCLLSSARRVRAAEGRHGEEEAECAGRKRLALRNPFLHPLQSGLHASGQSQAGCEALSTAVGDFKAQSVVSWAVIPPCHTGQCRPSVAGRSRRGFGLD